MANLIRPDDCVAGYRGLDTIFAYTNYDGDLVPYNCGQAAACTFLTHYGKFDGVEEKAGEVMRAIEGEHPPDNLGGYLGTSRRRVERICRAFGMRVEEAEGETELRAHLNEQRPVIVMVGVPGPKLWRWSLPAGHWMVAYGYDEQHLYLTNFGRMTWDQFRGGWRSIVPRLIRMNGRGLVVSDTVVNREISEVG
jgi:hypothetical protein